MPEDRKPGDQSSQWTGSTVVCVHQDTNEDPIEDASGICHLTSDSYSEVYCDFMEQFGQEEYYLGGDPTQHLESSGFCEDAQLPGNGSIGKMQMVAVKGKGEVKNRGEDGRSSSGVPHSDKKRQREQISPVSEEGRQVGSGGDREQWGSDGGSRDSLNEQIALVLIRLQEDMQNVLQRLHKLETLTALQAKLSWQTSNQPSAQRPSW